MREFKKRRTVASEILRISIGGLGILALFGVAIAASQATWSMYDKFSSAAAARTVSETKLSGLQERYTKINTEVESFSSERGLETAVRARYGVAKPGEGQIDIIRKATTTEEIRKQSGVFERLWRTFFVW